MSARAQRNDLDPEIDSPDPAPASHEDSASAPPAENHDHTINRRHLLELGAFSGAAIGVGIASQVAGQSASPAASPEASPAMSMDMNPQHANTNNGFVAFVPFQIKILSAACNRIIPTDDNGPGAEEAGVVYFIDREIASRKAYRGPRYIQGPFLVGEPTQGNQSSMDLKEAFRIGIESMDAYAKANYSGKGFPDLAAADQDKVLTDMSSGKVDDFGSISIDKDPLTPMPTGGQPGITAKAFFGLLLSFTMAGFFSDPVHGGNRDMVGWKLIGFPGAHLSWADQIENYGKPFKGDYISLGQYQQQVGGES